MAILFFHYLQSPESHPRTRYCAMSKAHYVMFGYEQSVFLERFQAKTLLPLLKPSQFSLFMLVLLQDVFSSSFHASIDKSSPETNSFS